MIEKEYRPGTSPPDFYCWRYIKTWAVSRGRVEGDREACPFKGAGAAADPYRKDPLSLSPETSLL